MDWFPICRDGGLDRYFFDAISALSAAGVDGVALVSYAESELVGRIEIRAAAPLHSSAVARLSGARAIAKEVFRAPVDLVNSHFTLYTFPWLRLIPTDVPLVVNFHGPWAGEMQVEAKTLKKRLLAAVAHRMERAVYQRADVLITLSDAFRQLLHARYGVPLSRIRVVPGGVDLRPYLDAPSREEARQRLGWPTNRPILLAVRRLARRMGLESLIDAMKEVRREFPSALLLIGGKGPERETLETRVREQGLAENVRLLGFVPEEELPLAYAAANLSIVPTLALEGFGLITVESLASGTPVLGTPVGGTPEILRPLNPKLIFDSAVPSAMGERIKAILRGNTLLPDRIACRAYVQKYGWPAVVPKLMSVYKDAIAMRREAAR